MADDIYKGKTAIVKQLAAGPDISQRKVQSVFAKHGGSFGNGYGQSRLRAAYAAWFTKRVIVPMRGLFSVLETLNFLLQGPLSVRREGAFLFRDSTRRRWRLGGFLLELRDRGFDR